MLADEGSPFSFSLEPMQVMQRTESCERCEVSQAGCDTWYVREDPVFRREKADIHVDAVLSVTQVPSSVFMNLTQRQQILMEEFAKEEQQELEKGSTAAGASG
ncbi:hypothetical protein BHE74_00032727 [Ensete ventricosum]|nr:hypothetical protein BHE74_00032727 [Ensete ventricosum]RZR93537.1 hypothetical protein BHM03_00022046 [Ensete ventricosum]